MKKFRFTLEAVRTVRQRQENEAQEQYARALLARQQAVAACEAIDDQLRGHSADLLRQLTTGCSAAQADQGQRFHRALETRRKVCLETLGEAERRVNAAFQAMLGARRQREMVDIYCEKQHARHLRNNAREEQKILDEFASARRLTSFHAIIPAHE